MTEEEFRNKQIPTVGDKPMQDRDTFAMAALTGIIASGRIHHGDIGAAKLAYQIADAMMDERKK